MQGQCPNCKGLFEIKQEWIGMKAPCPHCHQTITLLAMPSAGTSANSSSINLEKGDSTPASTPAQYSVPPAAPAQNLAPTAPAQYQTPPAPMQYQAPPNAPVTYQQPLMYGGGLQPASVFERLIAMVIDSVIVGIVGGIIGFVIGIVGFLIIGALSAAAGSDELAAIGGIILNLVASLLGLLLGVGYEGYFLSTSGATIGKKLMGIRVMHNGQNPTFMRAVGRYFSKFLSAMICWIGYIMACFTQDSKALHDMICDTTVVKG